MANITDAKPNSNITLDKVTVTEKGPEREFSSGGRLGRVCTAKIKDATGTMDLTLWNNDVDLVEKGDALKLTDGWCKEWNGNLQASTGKSGKIEKL
jgi:ssDNA-binding replication factor A large subunit